MAQWKALLTRLKDDNSMTKELVDDIRKWMQDVGIYKGLRGEVATQEFWINWKKKLLKAGNVDETDIIEWSNNWRKEEI